MLLCLGMFATARLEVLDELMLRIFSVGLDFDYYYLWWYFFCFPVAGLGKLFVSVCPFLWEGPVRDLGGSGELEA